MKLNPIFYAVFTVVLLNTLLVLAQDDKRATKPFYLCNMIVVRTTDDTEAIRQKLKESFIHQGYQITSLTVLTVIGRVKINDTFEMTVMAVVNDSLINFAGTYAYTPTGAAQASKSHTTVIPEIIKWKIEFKGKKNSDKMAAFAKMNALARAYGGKTYYFFQ